MIVREIANLDSIIAEAREMKKDGRYINGTIFHAMADEIERLRAALAESQTARTQLAQLLKEATP